MAFNEISLSFLALFLINIMENNEFYSQFFVPYIPIEYISKCTEDFQFFYEINIYNKLSTLFKLCLRY